MTAGKDLRPFPMIREIHLTSLCPLFPLLPSLARMEQSTACDCRTDNVENPPVHTTVIAIPALHYSTTALLYS